MDGVTALDKPKNDPGFTVFGYGLMATKYISRAFSVFL